MGKGIREEQEKRDRGKGERKEIGEEREKD